MQEGFVKINNIPTKVTTFGRWITEKPKKQREKLILIIPGNPGITGFYKNFMEILHRKHECPVWAIGYSGHEEYRQKSINTEFPGLIGLRQQIEQKYSFIKEYVPEDSELHVIGHSIGSYMTLELLKEPDIEKRIFKTYLLFPTIEGMIQTPNGRFLYRFVRPILRIVYFLSWFFSILPRTISLSLLSIYMFLTDMPFSHRETIYYLINANVLRQVFSLAFEELEQVKERDDENLKKNSHRVHILYSETDGWCLPEFYTKIKKDFPDIQARTSRFNHAFIFNENQDVAEVVSKWITDDKN
ncbi:lipid droplet-associated hydrolase-like [Coccinella septempunctata]|uniref:lipid droplet-associated hydrolase-like n=1 Tax=Coccinella septempunctata TaxID=41139 RepID=UPI001D089450|nr:lipid droplet-associated hydrolase-like [Coccinella septempunctata]